MVLVTWTVFYQVMKYAGLNPIPGLNGSDTDSVQYLRSIKTHEN